MNKNVAVAVLLAVLIVISGVQAIQLTDLKSKLEEGGNIKLAGKSTGGGSKSVATGSSGDLPKSLDKLPAMVEGC